MTSHEAFHEHTEHAHSRNLQDHATLSFRPSTGPRNPDCFPLPHGARKILLRSVEEAAVREKIVPARDLSNERSWCYLVQPEVAVHSKKVAVRDAPAQETACIIANEKQD